MLGDLQNNQSNVVLVEYITREDVMKMNIINGAEMREKNSEFLLTVVKAFFELEEGLFAESKVVLLMSVSNAREAVQFLHEFYTTQKFFIVFLFSGEEQLDVLPPNVVVMGLDIDKEKAAAWKNPEYVRSACAAAKGQGFKDAPLDQVRIIKGDGKKILVVDDTEKYRDAAVKALHGNHLTLVSSYATAMELLKNSNFDVVLTDLYLPVSAYHKAYVIKKWNDRDHFVPYGFLIANFAVGKGMKVAIVTDADHHGDPISAAFDDGGNSTIVYDNHKNWASALQRLS